MKYKFLFILAVLHFISCEDFFETTLELEEPVFEEQLVVNSILSNESLQSSRAYITKSVGLNDEIETSIIRDAEVNVIYPDGNVFPLPRIENIETYQNYNHEGVLPDMIAGQEYEIQVNTSNKNVSAKSLMPNSVNLISAIYTENGGLDEDGDEVSAIDIIIDDIPNEANYYKISANRIIEDSPFELYLTSNNALAIESTNYKDLLLKDDQFDGEDFKLRLQFYDFGGYYNPNPEESKFNVVFTTITKAQYDYDKLLKSYFENNDNPFASPVQIPSNIEGGIGLFAIENSQTFEVE